MDYSETIMEKRGLFDRLIGRPKNSKVVATNQMIAVWGTQGGVGVSSITALLAKMLHQWGFTVLVVEVSPTGGSILRLFGKKPVAEGLDTISRNHEKLNTELESIKINVVKGLSVLPKSGAPYNAQWVWQEDESRELLRIARKMAGFILVDAGHFLNDAFSRASLAEADHIVSLFRPTLIGLDSATRFYEHCKYANLSNKLIWLANQVQRAKDLAPLGSLIDQKIEYYIPWNKEMEIDTESRNVRLVVEELLHEMISAPTARVF